MEAVDDRRPADPAEMSGLLGIRIDLVSWKQLSNLFCSPRSYLQSPLQIVTLNVNFLTLTRRHLDLASVLNSAGLVVADGRILLWLLRLLGLRPPDQITGHDLFHLAVENASRQGTGVFLLGGADGVAEELAQRLQMRFPNGKFFGTHHGEFDLYGNTSGNLELITQIRSFDPTYLFVALGCPKQERWIAGNLNAVGVPIAVGVGCVFDVANGRLSRAPKWVQRAGLESGFQILVAPRRYARRYIFNDPPTVVAALLEIWRRRLLPKCVRNWPRDLKAGRCRRVSVGSPPTSIPSSAAGATEAVEHDEQMHTQFGQTASFPPRHNNSYRCWLDDLD